jgi:glucose uptake protein GlcU
MCQTSCCIAGFLNIAVSSAPVSYSVPIYQAALLLSTLALSGIVLKEYETLPPLAVVVFWVAVGLVVCGMALNARGASHSLEESEKEAEEDAELTLWEIARWEDEFLGKHALESTAAVRKAAAAKFR